MITFVPYFVSPPVVEWSKRLRKAMDDAGADFNDVEERERFRAGWSATDPVPEATLGDVLGHLEHAREVAGIDHIGLGGDYDGVSSQPVELADVGCYPTLFAALLERGWSEQDCAKLAGGNLLRVLRSAEEVAARVP